MKRFLEFGTPERTAFTKKVTPGEMPNGKFQEADHIKKMDFDERMMTDRQKLVQIQHYWDDLDHIASDDTKKKSLQRLGYKNIKLNSRGKITSFDEEVKIDELYKDYPGKGWVLGTKDEPKKLKDKDIVWRSKVHHWDNDVRSNNTRLIIVKNKGKFDMWAKSDKSGKIVFHFGTKPTLDAAKEFASIRKWQQKEEVEIKEEIPAHAKVMAKKGDSAKIIKKMHPEITDDELESIMGKKEERDYKSTKKAIKYHADEARNYRKEYDNYHAQPEQRERNAARLRARRQMVKAGKVEKFDKKDVHHKDNNPLNNKEDNLAVTTQNWNRTEPRLRKEEVKVDEKVEYYLDTSKDDTTKYVATDGDYWYTGKVGMKGGSAFLKFAATRISRSYFERAKLKKASPKEIEKDALKKPSIISTVDFKKLYTK